MTVPVERTNAVINTEQFLLELIDPKKTPRIPKAIRQRAHSLLRHYPGKYYMDMIADKEDGSTSAFYSKVFGKSYK